jgi:hypothetical protein
LTVATDEAQEMMKWLRIMIERRYTRDYQAPLVEGDTELNYGWRCVPQEPTPEPGWEIFDSSPDYKTGWQRRVFTVAGQICVLLSECAIYIGQEGLFQDSDMDDRGDCRGRGIAVHGRRPRCTAGTPRSSGRRPGYTVGTSHGPSITPFCEAITSFSSQKDQNCPKKFSFCIAHTRAVFRSLLAPV